MNTTGFCDGCGRGDHQGRMFTDRRMCGRMNGRDAIWVMHRGGHGYSGVLRMLFDLYRSTVIAEPNILMSLAPIGLAPGPEPGSRG